MNDTDPGIRIAVGVSGAGKTIGLRAQVYRAVAGGMPVMGMDRMHEMTEVPENIAPLTTLVATVAEGAQYIAQGARFVIVRPADVISESMAACAWARDYPGVAGVAISEAHRVAPNTGSPLPRDLEDVALAWRHHRVALWLDTQRLSLLSRTLTEQARELRVYAVGGERDLQRLREMGGNGLEDAAKEAARRLVAGEAGWHVAVRVTALPPYLLEREAL